MDNKTSNKIAEYQQSINDLEKIEEEVIKSETEDIRLKIETKHWYGYSEDMCLLKRKHKIDTDKSSMVLVLETAIKIIREKIDKLIDLEIEQRNKNN